jgi:hypothetical protein
LLDFNINTLTEYAYCNIVIDLGQVKEMTTGRWTHEAEVTSWFQWDGMTINEFPRYRELHVCKKLPRIRVSTRTGGDNREAYEDFNSYLTYLEGYVEDYDCTDNTYADFVYDIPERSHHLWKAFVERIAKK